MRRSEVAEQDLAYEMAMAADAAKAQESREAEAAMEASRREAEAMEARVAKAAAAALAAKEEWDAARDEARALAMSRLPPEPAQGAEGSFAFAVRLPDGSRLNRRFAAGTAVQSLVDWLDAETDMAGKAIVHGYPSKVLWSMPGRPGTPAAGGGDGAAGGSRDDGDGDGTDASASGGASSVPEAQLGADADLSVPLEAVGIERRAAFMVRNIADA